MGPAKKTDFTVRERWCPLALLASELCDRGTHRHEEAGQATVFSKRDFSHIFEGHLPDPDTCADVYHLYTYIAESIVYHLDTLRGRRGVDYVNKVTIRPVVYSFDSTCDDHSVTH